jgi:hypothetical protein
MLQAASCIGWQLSVACKLLRVAIASYMHGSIMLFVGHCSCEVASFLLSIASLMPPACSPCQREYLLIYFIRLFGTQLAEMPFVATRQGHRRAGHCRRLMKVLQPALLLQLK